MSCSYRRRRGAHEEGSTIGRKTSVIARLSAAAATCLLLSINVGTQIDALSIQTPTAQVQTKTSNIHDVETTARKRTGRQSYLHKQSHGGLPDIATSQEIRDLGISLSLRRPGSNSFFKGWINWRTRVIDAIQHDLSKNLPHPADRSSFENLFFRLGVASDTGEMPSFSDAGARSGYAIEFFCRARNLADLYIDTLNPAYTFPEHWVESMKGTEILGGGGEGEQLNVVSLAGGPGFDHVSAALVATFCSYEPSGGATAPKQAALNVTVFDYEDGWGDLVQAMNDSTQRVLENDGIVCSWGGRCDITKSIFDEANSACQPLLHSAQVWSCQYCVAENAQRLRESDWIFFTELASHAAPGSMFILSEVHPRLWPDVLSAVERNCSSMQVGFNRSGRQMLIRKGTDPSQDEVTISNKDRELVRRFRELDGYHTRKIESGWTRQAPKRWDD